MKIGIAMSPPSTPRHQVDSVGSSRTVAWSQATTAAWRGSAEHGAHGGRGPYRDSGTPDTWRVAGDRQAP